MQRNLTFRIHKLEQNLSLQQMQMYNTKIGDHMTMYAIALGCLSLLLLSRQTTTTINLSIQVLNHNRRVFEVGKFLFDHLIEQALLMRSMTESIFLEEGKYGPASRTIDGLLSSSVDLIIAKIIFRVLSSRLSSCTYPIHHLR